MRNRFFLASVLAGTCFCGPLRGQGLPSGNIGWYNGDWQPRIPSYSNWYASSQQFRRTYDDFIVPAGGWTITSVFEHADMPAVVTQASWEIRSGVSSGNGGCVVASGISNAAMTQIEPVGDGTYIFLLQVTGLSVQLAPGRYWLNVAPITSNTLTYVAATLGLNAIGNPPGNDAQSFYNSTTGSNFVPAQASGSGGTSSDFSFGVLVAPGATNPMSCQVAPPIDRTSAWTADLTSLLQQMTSDHSVPFPGVSLADFSAAANALAASVPTASDAQVRTGLQALVASIGDPHTDVEWPSGTFQYLPLTFYWFDDGIYVTAAAPVYSGLLGGRLSAIGRTNVDNVISRLTPLVAHDNDSWLKYLLPSRLVNTDFLFGTGLMDSSTGAAEIWVQPSPDAWGEIFEPQFQDSAARPMAASHGRSMATVQAVSQVSSMVSVFQGTPPLSSQHLDKNYWATTLDNGATVYFQFNSCTEDPNLASADFLAQLNLMLAQPAVQRLIVDMRYNTGGYAFLDSWITTIQASRFNQAGRLYVIVGKATFSAAMEATDLFHDTTAAIFVGEPTGGKPQFLLRRGDFQLPYYGIGASYSSGVESARLTGPTLVPDIEMPVTFEDYMKGIDRALDAILAIPPPRN